MQQRGLTLFQIADDLRSKMEVLTEHTLTVDEANDTLEAIQYDFEEKVRAIIAFSRELDEAAEVCTKEADRLSKRAKSLEGKAGWMRSYVLNMIQAVGYAGPMRFPEFTVSVQKNPPSVLIDEGAPLPPEYERVIPEQRAPDRKALLEALKGGATVPGVRLSEPTFRLSVR